MFFPSIVRVRASPPGPPHPYLPETGGLRVVAYGRRATRRPESLDIGWKSRDAILISRNTYGVPVSPTFDATVALSHSGLIRGTERQDRRLRAW